MTIVDGLLSLNVSPYTKSGARELASLSRVYVALMSADPNVAAVRVAWGGSAEVDVVVPAGGGLDVGELHRRLTRIAQEAA